MTLALPVTHRRSSFEARYYQLEAKAAVLDAWEAGAAEAGHPLLVMATGCHEAGQGVLMFDGSVKAVEDVRVGDQLMGPDSAPRNVLALARGEEEMVEIVPTKGEPWRVNRSHILSLVRTAQGRARTGGEIVDVTAADWLGWGPTAQHIHKLFRVGVDFPAQGLPLSCDPYLMGLLLGDGGMSQGSVFVPHEFKVAGRFDRWALLAGLIDSDGSKSGASSYDYVSASERLANDVAFVARSLGLAAYVKETFKRAQTGAGGIYWRVSISGDLTPMPVLLERKRATPRRQKKDVLRTGVQVRELGYTGRYYGFALDGDHRYLLDDFTVTHNTGKTFTAITILEEVIDAGERVVWLAHREELLLQALKSLQMAMPGVRGGVVQAGRDETTAQVVFASVDTLRTDHRLEGLLRDGHPAVVVVDEAHHSTSPTHQNAIEALLAPGTRMLGLTATPDREDGADLGEHWQIVYSYDIGQAVADGYLAPPYAVHVPIDLDLAGINQNDDAELGAALIRQGIVQATVDAMRQAHVCERLPDRDDRRLLDPTERSALVFTATVEQARLTAEALRELGIAARYLAGSTPKNERRAMLRAFEQGRIQVLCNPSVLTEGTDLPRAALGVLARPLQSWSLYVQCSGRVLRLFDGKDEGMLIDLAGATKVHSLAAAPVLIGGSRCKNSDNGVHSYVLDGDGPKGICEHCRSQVACFATLGPHEWVDVEDRRACRHCDSPQCKGSADGRHHWVPFEDASRICIDCDTEIPDPHAGMLKRKAPADLAKADDLWFRVTEVTPETWAIDVEDHGMLFMVGDRSTGQWDAWWLKKKARTPRRLSARPIPRDLVRTYADDIVRRATRRPGGRPVTAAQVGYAQKLGVETKDIKDAAVMAREISRAKARERVITLKLATRVRP